MDTLSVNLDSPTLLFGIPGRLVVQNSIPDDQDIAALGLRDQLVQLFSRSPLGCTGPFLIEFTKIPEVVAVVTVAVWFVGLAAWWKPERSDANVRKS